MNVSSRGSRPIKVDDAAHAMRSEYRLSHARPGAHPVTACKQKLMSLPIVLFSEDGKRKRLVCDTTTPLYYQQVAEYADLSRLDAMIEMARASAWPIALSKNVKETCSLYDRLKQDLATRFWFITHKNTKVLKSFEFWNSSTLRKSLAKILGPVIAYKRAFAKIDEYARAFKPVRSIVAEYRFDDLLKW